MPRPRAAPPPGQPITPDLLVMVDAIARHGSFAKAARELDRKSVV